MTTATAEPQRRPRPTIRELAHELIDVAVDLPRYATAPLHRTRHQRWGATDDEVGAAMPGDDLIDDVAYLATRAITIAAPPSAVWPWLVQVGCLRAGYYANDLLDNLGHPSADRILPEYQHLEIGQWVPMSPTPTDVTAFKVAGFERNKWLLWQQPLSSWSWTLTELPGGQTRLVTRLRIHLDWHHKATSLLSVVLNEFGDYPMMRRMLLGIRDRAEKTHTGGRANRAEMPRSDDRALVPEERDVRFFAVTAIGSDSYPAPLQWRIAASSRRYRLCLFGQEPVNVGAMITIPSDPGVGLRGGVAQPG